MSNESVGLQRLTVCPMHVPSRDKKKGVDMMAHVDDPFVVVLERCWTEDGKQMKLKTWWRRTVFTDNGLEIHGGPKHAAIVLKETGKGNAQDCELTPLCRHQPAGDVGR